LFQGQRLFKRKLSSGARRSGESGERRRRNLAFIVAVFA